MPPQPRCCGRTRASQRRSPQQATESRRRPTHLRRRLSAPPLSDATRRALSEPLEGSGASSLHCEEEASLYRPEGCLSRLGQAQGRRPSHHRGPEGPRRWRRKSSARHACQHRCNTCGSSAILLLLTMTSMDREQCKPPPPDQEGAGRQLRYSGARRASETGGGGRKAQWSPQVLQLSAVSAVHRELRHRSAPLLVHSPVKPACCFR